MHHASHYLMGEFVEEYLDKEDSLKILDVGSMEVDGSGTYRDLFDNIGWEYVGLDTNYGPNVDIATMYPYDIPSRDDTYDVVISGQALEHMEYFWVMIKEMVRVLKEDGLMCIIVPSDGQVHRYPVDCWRFNRDGLIAMAKWGELQVLKAEVTNHSEWKDAILIARKWIY